MIHYEKERRSWSNSDVDVGSEEKTRIEAIKKESVPKAHYSHRNDNSSLSL